MNVLFIMSDQHNAHALGCYGNGYGGATPSMTPNLDKLAREGELFENAFCTSPQCCPSRYSIMTGRWPHATGLRWNGIWEPRGQATFPALFRTAGYETATIGKHHMMWLDYMPSPLVEDHGFNRTIDFDDYVSHCASEQQQVYSRSGNFWSMPDLPFLLQSTGYTFNTNEFHTPGYTADEVIRFLETCAAGTTASPFVCFYSMYLPHTPVLPGGRADPQDWAHAYHPPSQLDLPPNLEKVASTSKLALKQARYASVSDAEWQEILSYYYGLVLQIDWNIGRVLERLEELGLAENTLVIYTSDHGDMASEMRCWDKGSGLYDATTRVPLILRLPGVLPPRTTSDALVSTLDLFPTITELAGIPVPDEVREELDGRSLVDLILRGERNVDWRTEIFAEAGSPKLPSILRSRMVRTKTAKYTYHELRGGQEEFYDLVADPFEIDDLIDDPDPSVQLAIADLRGRLDRWWNGEAGHAPVYEVTGEALLAPVPAAEPFPLDGAQGVPRAVDPAWLPSTAAESQLVYFGTDAQSLRPFRDLVEMEHSFNPGSLAALTTYYWRVDASNSHGTTPGPVWSFTTAAGGSGGPGLATDPSPAHRMRDVGAAAEGLEDMGLRTTLSWRPPGDADAQDLYLGPEGEMQLVASDLSAETTSFPAAVKAGLTYHWRVDTTNSEGKTEGDVWIFRTTGRLLPEPARLAFPPHMGRLQESTLALEWLAGQGATSHDVYMGTSFPLAFLGNQTESHLQAKALTAGRTYYWRVDEVNAFGTRPGWTWRFTVE